MSTLKHKFILGCSSVIMMVSGCASTGVDVKEVNPDQAIKGVSGVGLESQDIDKMTKQMVTEILALHLPVGGADNTSDDLDDLTKVPRIIIDSQKLVNESSQVINTSLLADRLRIGLLRESRGQLLFISRENSDLAIEEAKLSGVLNLFPADYRLVGKITSLSSFSQSSGIKSNFAQVSFELIDLRTSVSVWGNYYQVKKVGADDTIYR